MRRTIHHVSVSGVVVKSASVFHLCLVLGWINSDFYVDEIIPTLFIFSSVVFFLSRK
jgi:hypothetical protein